MDALTRLQRYLDGDPVQIMSIDHVLSIMEEIRRKDAELADSQAMLGLAALKLSDMREALERLVDQIERGTFVDELGHKAKMLKAFHDALAVLRETKGDGT